MKCPACEFYNRKEAKFCSECGFNFEIACPSCASKIRTSSKFCDVCGYEMITAKKTADKKAENKFLSTSSSKGITTSGSASAESERKHITVLFSDLTGYTAMSEKIDPEEVKEITTHIFDEISKIIVKYEGFIEKFAGDAVMALFGVPKSHEDDPIRAVKAAREIHKLVDALSLKLETRIGHRLSMHTGINTGLVVTGEVDMERGTHGVAGATINLASRLSNLAKPGEILIDSDTCYQAEGHFACEYLKETTIKGKAEPIQVHKVTYQRDKPITVHRLSGLRADLIGRKVELAELSEAVDNLRKGRGKIFSICGAAGTGKSRLVEEFKATIESMQIQWLEAHAYAYSQNIPYFPLIDLLNRIWHIQENDSPENVSAKIESGIEQLVGNNEEIVSYVGGLYSLNDSEVDDVSPEFWKARLQSAIKSILSALALKAPTVYFFEDLHWADPSFVELLRSSLLEIRDPAIVICVYRPTFTLFTGDQLGGVGKYYHEIQLQDLSRSEAQDMLESLLKTESIPNDLARFVQSKAEGNPFYLEELVNSLIESGILVRNVSHWKITKSLTEAEISSSIHGLISGRIDRLERETKRILQDASVIGRTFLYEILKKITERKNRIDGELNILERVDLIRTRTIQPDLEYMFKHPLTHEIVYNSLLKKERKEIHEQIALVMEDMFQYRLLEFYETLAFHFKRGHSALKAVDYLMKSAKKNVRRYAIEESHEYYHEAFELLSSISNRTEKEDQLLIDLLIEWAYVFYYRGDFNGLIEYFNNHKDLAESINDKPRLGMFNAWLGFALFMNGRGSIAYPYLRQALKLGEEIGNSHIIGYACTWLAWSSWDLGLLEDAILYGERASEIAKSIATDHYLYFKPLGAIGLTCLTMGDRKRCVTCGTTKLDYGKKHSNIRSLNMGHISMAFSHMIAGDFPSAVKSLQKAISIAVDPVYTYYAGCFLGATHILMGQLREAEPILIEAQGFCRKFGFGANGLFLDAYLGMLNVAKGQFDSGLEMIEEAIRKAIEKGRKTCQATFEHILGSIYLQLLDSGLPTATEKSELHLMHAVSLSKQIGAEGTLSQALFDLGRLHKSKGDTEQAKKCLIEAIALFEECEAEMYLTQARNTLKSLG